MHVLRYCRLCRVRGPRQEGRGLSAADDALSVFFAPSGYAGECAITFLACTVEHPQPVATSRFASSKMASSGDTPWNLTELFLSSMESDPDGVESESKQTLDMVMGLLREAKESGSSTVRVDPGAPINGIVGRIFVRVCGGVDEAIRVLGDVAQNLGALLSEGMDFAKNYSEGDDEISDSVSLLSCVLMASSLRDAVAAGEEGEPAQSEQPAATCSSESPAALGPPSGPL